MTKPFATLLTILLTAVIVGGGVYFWQQSQLQSIEDAVKESQSEHEELLDDVESTEANVNTNEEQDKKTSSLEANYVNETYGYSLNLPTNFNVYTEGYDNKNIEDERTIWVGTTSDFWTDGFYVRIVNNLNSRIREVQKNVTEVVEQNQVILGSKSAIKIVVGWDIGYQVAYYFVEVNNQIFEIQVVNSNTVAQNVIQTIQFSE